MVGCCQDEGVRHAGSNLFPFKAHMFREERAEAARCGARPKSAAASAGGSGRAGSCGRVLRKHELSGSDSLWGNKLKIIEFFFVSLLLLTPSMRLCQLPRGLHCSQALVSQFSNFFFFYFILKTLCFDSARISALIKNKPIISGETWEQDSASATAAVTLGWKRSLCALCTHTFRL